jgi:CheY-like chemotaxis protein
MSQPGSRGVSSSHQPTKHILVAEDSQDDFFLLRIAFEKAALPSALHHVENGEQAIQYLTGQAPFSDRTAHPFPQLLILDLKMPLTNGFEVLKFLSAHPDIKIPVVLVLSGSAIPEHKNKAIELGAAAYFPKPLELGDYKELAKTIHNLTAP